MLFDLMNAPVTFQSMMNHILHEFLNKSVIVYLNDILIYSDFMNEHWKHVKDVLKKLAEHYLYVKSSKCMINKFTLKFCEHVVEKKNIWSLISKIAIIKNWSVSMNIHEVYQFLNLVSFYCWFIKDFVKITALMHDLLKKSDMMLQKKKFWSIMWNAQCQLAFNHLKKALTSDPVLQ